MRDREERLGRLAESEPAGSATRPLIEELGENALLVRLGDRIEPELSHRTQFLASEFRAAGFEDLIDVVPAFASVALHFEAGRPVPRSRVRAFALQSMAGWCDASRGDAAAQRSAIEIPVRYGGDYGPDLAALAEHSGLTPDDVVDRHAAADYEVAMIGFLPGFPYLLGLDPALDMPRRDTPRARVPAGSIAIGGAQCGIYPCDAPGGWQLIGQTDFTLFDAGHDPPTPLQPGQRVKFIVASRQGPAREKCG